MSPRVTIGDVAARAGVSAATIRHYESEGLVVPTRARNGYRVYGEPEIEQISFVARARASGLSLEECHTLMALWGGEGADTGAALSLARRHLAEIDARLEDLSRLRATLAALAGPASI